MNRKGFEFSFAWIFAIIAGAVILFLAIYFVISYVQSSRTAIDTTTAKQLTILFEPLETGLSDLYKPRPIILNQETRVYNKCYENNFGKNEISVASSSGIGGKWQNSGIPIEVTNKYIFSNDSEQGKTIYYFAKPFNFPWKISELIFLSTEKFCFVNTPLTIKDELRNLGIENIKFENCTNEKRVCFGMKCEISVYGTCFDNCGELGEFDYGYVMKNNEKMYYTGSLIYAAIFSSKDIYECNLVRLMKRAMQQAFIFSDEATFLADKCNYNTNLLLQYASVARINNSQEIVNIRSVAKNLDEQNDLGGCNLW